MSTQRPVGAGVLELESLTVRYGPTVAVDAVDLSVGRGEVLALLGPSGSGKSSLLRAVAGLEPVAGGALRWEGRDIAATPVHRRGFGLMFQDGQLFPHQDVAGNVAYGLRHLSRSDRARRVGEVLGTVGMGEYSGRAVTSLSGGQAQRVALARSLAPRPALLLLDEPLSALDRSLRERLSTEIRQILHDSGSTCVYVTHDQDEAFAVADRIGVMIGGRLVALGTPVELWRQPGRRDVAEFLGQGPCLPVPGGGRVGWRAIAPGASQVVEVLEGTPAVPPSCWSEAELAALRDPGSSAVLTMEAVVIHARGGRGQCALEVEVAGGVRLKAVAPGHLGEAASLLGRRVRLRLDLANCPVVADA